MSDREFEKQVKTRMDELKLTPSASVWQGVELTLDNTRRRRRRLILVPLILLMLAGGGYLAYTGMESSPATGKTLASETSGAPSPRSSKAGNDDDQSNTLSVTTNDSENKTDKSAAPEPRENPDTNAELKTPIHPADTHLDTQHKGTEITFEKPSTATRPPAHRTLYKKKAIPTPRAGDLPVKTKDQYADMEEAYSDVIEDRLSVHLTVIDSASLRIAEVHGPLSNSSFHIAEVPVPKHSQTQAVNISEILTPKPQASRKWRLGVSAGAGISNIKEGAMFELKQAEVADVSTSTPLNNFGPSFGFVYTPAVIRPGISYSVSAYMQRAVSRRLSVSIGLGYSQFNVSADVGRRVDSSLIVSNALQGFDRVSTYYTPDRTNRYNMRYQFIEVPVHVQYRVNNSARLPIYLNAAVAGSRLIGTNALHFDGLTGVYYRNNDLFNKMQVSASTGLGIGILSRSRMPLIVGPTVRYQISKMLQKDISGGNHLVSFGAEVRMLINN